jgi:hypothetical protein
MLCYDQASAVPASSKRKLFNPKAKKNQPFLVELDKMFL